MTNRQKRSSALSSRIQAGQADPISAEERAIVAGLRATYDQKFGRGEQNRPARKTA